MFAACFLLGLMFDPEDGGDIFIRNVGDYQTTRHHIREDCSLHRYGNLDCGSKIFCKQSMTP
jgi:hypothetical protein